MKLTNYHRDAIARRAADSKYPLVHGDLMREQQDPLAREVYATLLNPELRKMLEGLPRDWIDRDNSVYFAHGDNKIGQLRLMATETEDQVLPCKGHCRPLGRVTGDLEARCVAMMDAVRDAYNARRSLERSVRSVLGACGTMAQLRRIWPEGEEFYARGSSGTPPANLPMVQTAAINAALGLPREVALA